mgnify:CR=1 FL=1
MNRFDLEDAMSALHSMGDDIDAILHSYMDAKVRPTEDEMGNMLIGAKALHNARYQKMWEVFEELIKNGTISNKNIENNLDPITKSLYDDGTLKSNDSND